MMGDNISFYGEIRLTIPKLSLYPILSGALLIPVILHKSVYCDSSSELSYHEDSYEGSLHMASVRRKHSSIIPHLSSDMVIYLKTANSKN